MAETRVRVQAGKILLAAQITIYSILSNEEEKKNHIIELIKKFSDHGPGFLTSNEGSEIAPIITYLYQTLPLLWMREMALKNIVAFFKQ